MFSNMSALIHMTVRLGDIANSMYVSVTALHLNP